jgi:hypothetical protein
MSIDPIPLINGEEQETDFQHGPGVDEAPLNDLDDGEAGLDPTILQDDLMENGSLGLG